MGELLAFNGDNFLAEEFLRLRDKYGIQHVIETGTYKGDTTLWLSEHFSRVTTIELNSTYYAEAQDKIFRLANPKCEINMFLGNSPEHLEKSLKHPWTICFLDAHWNMYNPLLDELDVIRNSGVNPIIVIHDFQVPEHPEFGFDTYPGITYNWDYIKDHVDESYDKYYNTAAAGAQRGVIFLVPSWL